MIKLNEWVACNKNHMYGIPYFKIPALHNNWFSNEVNTDLLLNCWIHIKECFDQKDMTTQIHPTGQVS